MPGCMVPRTHGTCGLPGAGSRHGDHIVPGEDEGEALALAGVSMRGRHLRWACVSMSAAACSNPEVLGGGGELASKIAWCLAELHGA